MNQQQIPILSATAPVELLPDELIERCATFTQALGVAISQSQRHPGDNTIAAELGVQASVWSRISNKPKNAPAYMPEDKYAVLCALLGNVGVIQWLAYRAGFRLVPIVENRKQRLQRELAEIEAREVA